MRHQLKGKVMLEEGAEVEVDLRDIESRHSDEKLQRVVEIALESQRSQGWMPLPHNPVQNIITKPQLGLYRLSPDAIVPTRATQHAACWDVYALEDFTIGGRRRLFAQDSDLGGIFITARTGWRLVIPEGYRIDVLARSGLAAKRGVTVLNAPGTIDHDYEGELMIILGSLSFIPQEFKAGDRIAQIALERVQEFTVAEVGEKDLPVIDSNRTGGLGSSGA